MSVIRLPHNWQPRPYQRRLWRYLESGGKRAIEIAHRRWGKDDVALHWAAVSAMQKPATYWHMLPEYAQARKAIWNAVNPHTGKRRIDEAFPDALRANTNEQEMFIRFKNGSTWQVVGSDSYNSLVGTPPYGLVVSEWALADPAAWAYLAPILEENGGWAVFITTPRGRNHAHGMYKMGRADPRWFAEVQTVEDTGFSLERVEAARKEYASIFGIDAGNALIEQEYYCSFEAAILGAIYGAAMSRADKDGRIGKVPHDPRYPVHTAWDLGRKDATVCWWWQVINGEVRLIDYWAASFQDVQVLCEQLYGRHINVLDRDMRTARVKRWEFGAPIEGLDRRQRYRYGQHFVPHDAANELQAAGGRSIVEQAYDLGIRMRVVASTSQQNSQAAARVAIDHSRFDETLCEAGIEAMKQYHSEWDDEKKIFKPKPRHDWSSDPADAYEIIGQVWKTPLPEKKKEDPRFLDKTTANEIFWPKSNGSSQPKRI